MFVGPNPITTLKQRLILLPNTAAHDPELPSRVHLTTSSPMPKLRMDGERDDG